MRCRAINRGLLAAGLLVVASCGGSGGQDAASPTTATPASESTTETTASTTAASTTTAPPTTAEPTTSTTEATTTTSTTLPEPTVPDAQLVCDTIDVEALNSGALIDVGPGEVVEDYCRFPFNNTDGALRIGVAETSLEDPIASFTAIMRLTGDVYTTPLADGGVLGEVNDRTAFYFKDGVNLWEISVPPGAIDRNAISRIGTAMTMSIPPRDIDPSEAVVDLPETDGDDDNPEPTGEAGVTDEEFCAAWDDIEDRVDAVLETNDDAERIELATALRQTLADLPLPDRGVLGWEEFGGGLDDFLVGVEVDDFDAMEAGLDRMEEGDALFNVWLGLNC